MHALNDPLVFNWNWDLLDPEETDTDLIRCLARWVWRVRGQVVTRHHVNNNRMMVQDELFVSLLPFTEFVLANWWALLHEQSVRPSQIDRLALHRRHTIDVHSDGFVYPSVSLFGAGSHIRVSTQAREVQSAGLRFITTQTRDPWTGLPREILEQRLLELANDTLQRLGQRSSVCELRACLEAIENSRMDVEETRFCIAAGLLGEDPYAMEPSVQQDLLDTVAQFGEDFALELFTVLDASSLAISRAAIGNVDAVLAQGSQELAAAIIQARQDYSTPGESGQESPWQRGYTAASAIRERIGLDPGFTDFSSLSKVVLGIDWVPKERHSLPLNAQGFGRCDEREASVILAPPPRRNRLFVWAQMLGDMLLSGAQNRFIAIRNASDRQKAARAFAAELLLPASVLEARKWHDIQWRQALIEHYGVSPAIAEYQYRNRVAPNLLGVT